MIAGDSAWLLADAQRDPGHWELRVFMISRSLTTNVEDVVIHVGSSAENCR